MSENLRQRGNEIGDAGRLFAASVRRYRRFWGWNLEDLSERLRAAGRPISVAALSRLENGERRIDIDDAVAISEVLMISIPNMLKPVKLPQVPGLKQPTGEPYGQQPAVGQGPAVVVRAPGAPQPPRLGARSPLREATPGRAIFTRAEAAELLGVDPRTVTTGIREGTIPSVQVGRRVLIPRDQLLAMLGTLPNS